MVEETGNKEEGFEEGRKNVKAEGKETKKRRRM
jgi:hypothetical protein